MPQPHPCTAFDIQGGFTFPQPQGESGVCTSQPQGEGGVGLTGLRGGERAQLLAGWASAALPSQCCLQKSGGGHTISPQLTAEAPPPSLGKSGSRTFSLWPFPDLQAEPASSAHRLRGQVLSDTCPHAGLLAPVPAFLPGRGALIGPALLSAKTFTQNPKLLGPNPAHCARPITFVEQTPAHCPARRPVSTCQPFFQASPVTDAPGCLCLTGSWRSQ